MSKTIEFVNRKIKDKKDQLKRLEKLRVTSSKYDLQINEILTKNTEEDIEHLQQIKCELEAWEIVKDKQVDIFYINVCKNADVYNKYKTFIKKLNNDEFNKIRKALEVEDV